MSSAFEELMAVQCTDAGIEELKRQGIIKTKSIAVKCGT
jgi:hypothetical protein